MSYPYLRPTLWFFALLLTVASAQITSLSEPLPPPARAALTQAREAAREALASYDTYTPDKPLFREAIRLGREAVRLAPDNPEALRFLAELHGVTGFYGPAFETWERFVEAGGVLDRNAQEQLVRAGTKLGYAQYERGDLEGALGTYRRLTELAPESVLAHRWVGRILLEQGRPRAAIPVWERVLELQPGNVGAEHFLRLSRQGARYGLEAVRTFYEGLRLYEAGRLQQARARFQEATQLSPEYAEAWAYLGRTAFEREDYGAAARAYGRASALEPQNETYRYFWRESQRRQAPERQAEG